jgi:hypothetical protein
MAKLIAIVLTLAFLTGCAHGNTGPQWAVWTHSEDKEECEIKSVFWMAVSTAIVIYLVERNHKRHLREKNVRIERQE